MTFGKNRDIKMPICLKRKTLSMRNTSHDIRMRNMETDKANRKLTQNSAKDHGESNVRNNTKRLKKINLDKRKDLSKYYYTAS